MPEFTELGEVAKIKELRRHPQKDPSGRIKGNKINQGARMIKFIIILISCSLTLAAGVRAEQQQDPKKKSAQKSNPAPKQQFTPKQQFSPKQHAVTNARVPAVRNTVPNTHVQGVHAQHNNAPIHNNVSKQQLHKMPAVQSTVQSNKIQTNKQQIQTNKQQLQTNKQQLQTNKQQLQTNKLNKQTVMKIQSQHQNFHAQPNTAIASAQFNPNYRIQAAQNWNGTQYNAFRSYQSQWHDQGWWRSNYDNLSLIGGGWYYWNSGYWYPAWGYDTAAAYYPYDGPVYVGNNAAPLDQVVANVQSALQEQGYYHGEVDGLLGPLTREALAAYQRAQGLYATATIDQPTLESLGLG
jgi:Putative peptidoglycan binding domain